MGWILPNKQKYPRGFIMEKLEPIHNLLILDKIFRENHTATINWTIGRNGLQRESIEINKVKHGV